MLGDNALVRCSRADADARLASSRDTHASAALLRSILQELKDTSCSAEIAFFSTVLT